MKKLILTLAAFSALTFSAVAQNNQKTAGSEQSAMTPEQKAEKETKNATEKLGLNADQQAKFKVYSLERARTIRSLREKAKASTNKEEKQKLRAEGKTVNDKYFANVNSILTADQQVKWAEHKKKMDAKRNKNQAQD
jgi:hypothetical protein